MTALRDLLLSKLSGAAPRRASNAHERAVMAPVQLPVVAADTRAMRVRCTEFPAFDRALGKSYGAAGVSLDALVLGVAPEGGPSFLQVRGQRSNADVALKEAKGKGRGFVFAHLEPEQRRSTETVQMSDLVALDADGISAEDLSRVVGQLRSSSVWFLAHSTFSDGIKEPERGRRVRFYLLPSRPVTKVEPEGLTAQVGAVLGVQITDCP